MQLKKRGDQNKKDSNPKYLGIKAHEGNKISAGSIIVRQRGTKYTLVKMLVWAEISQYIQKLMDTLNLKPKNNRKFVSVYETERVN